MKTDKKHKKKKQKAKKQKKWIGLLGSLTFAIVGLSKVLVDRYSSSSITSNSTVEKSECNIKGNISTNTGNKIYHLPGMEDYSSTKIDTSRGERWFCTESEAIQSGWRKAPR